MRSRIIPEMRRAWPIFLMYAGSSLFRSGYYGWTTNDLSQCVRSNTDLDRRINESFTEHQQGDGVPRGGEALHDEGISCSENRIAPSMRSLGLKAIQEKKLKVTIDPNHSKPVSPDLIKQDFHLTASNQKATSASPMSGLTMGGCICPK